MVFLQLYGYQSEVCTYHPSLLFTFLDLHIKKCTTYFKTYFFVQLSHSYGRLPKLFQQIEQLSATIDLQMLEN